MAAERKSVTLYSPDGREYRTSDPSEIAQLVSGLGYSKTPPKSDSKKSK